MKQFLLLIVAGIISIAAYSQPYESKITYDKKKQDAFAVDYSYSVEAVQNAIIEKMRTLGYKPKEEKGLFNRDKGFLIFSNAYLTDISGKSYDYLVKVEAKSKKKEEAVLYFIMMSNGANARGTLQVEEAQAAKEFLSGLHPHVEAANLELQIIAQEDLLSKAEKKLTKLRDDQADLEKKIDKNKKDQEQTIADIENKQKELEALKNKRS